MKKPKGCAPKLWKKASEKEKQLFIDFFTRFESELKVLKDAPKSTDDVIAHNLAWVATWMLTCGDA